MAHQITEWTVEIVHGLPDDGNRYEVIDGRLFVNPPPSYAHQAAVLALAFLLESFLRQEPLGSLVIAPAGVDFDARTEVEPDLFVTPLVAARKPRSFKEAGRLLLAIEVLSPSSLRTDRREKRDLYSRMNVPEYWIVDLDRRLIERWRPGGVGAEVCAERISWEPEPGRVRLDIDLAELFGRIDAGP